MNQTSKFNYKMMRNKAYRTSFLFGVNRSLSWTVFLSFFDHNQSCIPIAPLHSEFMFDKYLGMHLKEKKASFEIAS